MTNIKVFLLEEAKQGGPEALQKRLDPRIQLRYGKEVPAPADYEILIAAVPPREFLDASPNLQALIIPYAGPPAKTQALLVDYPSLAVHNTPYNYIATAETGLALLLASAKFLAKGDGRLRQGDWTLRYSRRPQLILHGRTALILGYGRIGQHMAPVCRALGMEVIGVRRTVPPNGPQDDVAKVYGIEQLMDLLPHTDVLLVALPWTPETEGVVGPQELAALKDGAIVVNIGRGSVIDETALYQALVSGKLSAAGLDVWYNYPRTEAERTSTWPSQYPFHELENVVLSPHRGGWLGSEDESRMVMLADMLNRLAAGEPLPNPVNIALGY
ncbi:hydroxyacid dehydrogenase [Chloroflexi bacterium TSY]|nr:hydroxyacid dehydrogenase [Chloroflexi bacterium TSY]